MLTSDQYDSELNEFLRLVRGCGAKTAIEIGAGECGTSVLLAETMGADSFVISIDLPIEDGGTSGENEAEAERLVGNRFRLIRGRSHHGPTLEAVIQTLGKRPVDVLFIDAEHTHNAALADYGMYRAFKPKVTGFHDICTDELWPFWNGIRGAFPPQRTLEIIKHRNQRGCGIGVILP